MFIGHFAMGFAARSVAPRVPLAALAAGLEGDETLRVRRVEAAVRLLLEPRRKPAWALKQPARRPTCISGLPQVEARMRRYGRMKLAASLVFLFALAFPGGAQAHEKKDALDLLAKAQKHLKDVGVDKAVADFQDKAGAFVNGDLYVFAYSFDGVCLANAQNQKLVGKNRLEVEDVNGKKYIADMVAGAKAKGTGSVDYMFVNPETKRIEPKTTFFERVPGKDMFVACGIYRK